MPATEDGTGEGRTYLPVQLHVHAQEFIQPVGRLDILDRITIETVLSELYNESNKRHIVQVSIFAHRPVQSSGSSGQEGKEGGKQGDQREGNFPYLTRQRRRRAFPIARVEPHRDPHFPPEHLRRVHNELVQQPIIVVALAYERLQLDPQYVSHVSMQSDHHQGTKEGRGKSEGGGRATHTLSCAPLKHALTALAYLLSGAVQAHNRRLEDLHLE